VSLRSTLEKQAALIMHPHIEIAAYVGRYGWVTVTLADEDTMQLALELIDESYDLVVAGLPKSKRPTEQAHG
jgi:predicted DNA-binding protein (MmcQ/YjbR family)